MRRLFITLAISMIVAIPGPAETSRSDTFGPGTSHDASTVKTVQAKRHSAARAKHRSASVTSLVVDPVGEVGLASWYGDEFNGRPTANGEVFDKNAFSAAHLLLPLGSWIKVTNLSNQRSLLVRVNDRGPYVSGRILDLSEAAARRLGIMGAGVGMVEIHAVRWINRRPEPKPPAFVLSDTLLTPPQM